MLIPCKILRPFPYTKDGFTQSHAEVGHVEDIPAALVDGLEREGYLKPVRNASDEAKAAPGAPENKAVRASPENKSAARRKG